MDYTQDSLSVMCGWVIKDKAAINCMHSFLEIYDLIWVITNKFEGTLGTLEQTLACGDGYLRNRWLVGVVRIY